MPLTSAQLQIVNAHIAASADLSSLPLTPDGHYEIARLLNMPAAPDFWVLRSLVTLLDIQLAFDWDEIAGLTTANLERLNTMAAWAIQGVNPSSSTSKIISFFNNIFSGAGGTNNRANLAAVWRRRVRRVERLFATGVGSTGNPGLLGYEGVISPSDVEAARVP